VIKVNSIDALLGFIIKYRLARFIRLIKTSRDKRIFARASICNVFKYYVKVLSACKIAGALVEHLGSCRKASKLLTYLYLAAGKL
jgi:hypothetical protein